MSKTSSLPTTINGEWWVFERNPPLRRHRMRLIPIDDDSPDICLALGALLDVLGECQCQLDDDDDDDGTLLLDKFQRNRKLRNQNTEARLESRDDSTGRVGIDEATEFFDEEISLLSGFSFYNSMDDNDESYTERRPKPSSEDISITSLYAGSKNEGFFGVLTKALKYGVEDVLGVCGFKKEDVSKTKRILAMKKRLAQVETQRRHELEKVQLHFDQKMTRQIKMLEDRIIGEVKKADHHKQVKRETAKSKVRMHAERFRDVVVAKKREANRIMNNDTEDEANLRRAIQKKLKAMAQKISAEDSADDIDFSLCRYPSCVNVFHSDEDVSLGTNDSRCLGTHRNRATRTSNNDELANAQSEDDPFHFDLDDIVASDSMSSTSKVQESSGRHTTFTMDRKILADTEEDPAATEEERSIRGHMRIVEEQRAILEEQSISSERHIGLLAEALDDIKYVHKRNYRASRRSRPHGRSIKSRSDLPIDRISNENLEMLGAAIGNSFSCHESELTEEEVSVITDSSKTPRKLLIFRSRLASLNLTEKKELLGKLRKGLQESQLKLLVSAMTIGYKQTHSILKSLGLLLPKKSFRFEPSLMLSSVPE